MPVQLDYTTLYGAALCLEASGPTGATLLSRLLSLSQLVEALVLHDRLEYEVGFTTDWQPYREALERSALYKHIGPGGLPLRGFGAGGCNGRGRYRCRFVGSCSWSKHESEHYRVGNSSAIRYL